jgi:hypothetical protein
MNLRSRVGRRTAVQSVARTFDRLWRAGMVRIRVRTDTEWGLTRASRHRSGPNGVGVRRKTRVEGACRRFRRGDPGQREAAGPGEGPAAFWSTREGRPVDPQGGEGWRVDVVVRVVPVTRSVRCGRWPHPQNAASRWRRRVRGVEMPWSAANPTLRVAPAGVARDAAAAPMAFAGEAGPPGTPRRASGRI